MTPRKSISPLRIIDNVDNHKMKTGIHSTAVRSSIIEVQPAIGSMKQIGNAYKKSAKVLKAEQLKNQYLKTRPDEYKITNRMAQTQQIMNRQPPGSLSMVVDTMNKIGVEIKPNVVLGIAPKKSKKQPENFKTSNQAYHRWIQPKAKK